METSYERGTLVDPFENIFAEHIFGQSHLDDWRASKQGNHMYITQVLYGMRSRSCLCGASV